MNATSKRAKAIFVDLIGNVPPLEWDARLQQVCDGDDALLRRVTDLLSAHVKEGSFLDEPAIAVDVTVDHKAEAPGTVIGPYKLLEQIGEGGMGLVYMAEQERPLRRMVALKIIKPGMDSRQVLARFEAEKQALAMMDHETIARVFDAGTTDAGHPYFVMELVRGIPIDAFCDHKRLTVRERLELFVPVCQAVQHAHQKGIIHRDLKPSNVLVTMHDVQAVPKVIDFGIAKALGPSLTDHTLHTGFAQLIGTPLYMSPEQAEMNQLGVDTRSDVYSLGVLLYELLTGTTPFDKEALTGSGLNEMRRMIREDEPPRPSARVSALQPEALSTTSQRRGTDPRRISAALHGELDWIVMKSLEKDRSRRYESASAFATDIQLYLDDEPVLAGPPSTMYTFHKFARKHRAALATAVAIAASLILGITASAWQAVRATTAEAQANANATQAQEKAQEATTQRNEAQRQRDEVQALNEKLAAKEQQLQRTLYAAHMNLAKHAWDEAAVPRALELLEQHRPKPGESDLRGFEWYYLDHLCHAEILSIKDAGGAVFSPDGTRLASTVAGGPATSPELPIRLETRETRTEVKVWDGQTGRELVALKGAGGVLAFSPDGKRLVTRARSDQGGEVKMWDAQTGQELTTFKGHTGPVFSVAFSPDGKRLACVSATFDSTKRVYGAGEMKVWDVQTGRELLVLKHTGSGGLSPGSVAFSPDGKRLAFGSDTWDDTKRAYVDCEVQLWDAQTGQALLAIKGLTERVLSMAFSPDGKRLAGAATDHTVTVWDAQTGQELFTLKDTSGSVTFSPDGKRLASSSYGGDRTVKVWDAQTGQELLSCKGHNGQISSVAFSPDGKRLASAGMDRMVHVWDALTGQELLTYKGHSSMIRSVAFSPDGTRLASAELDRTVKVWDATTSPEARSFGGPTSGVWSVVFSLDGKRLAGANAADWKNPTVKVWDASTGQELLSVKGGTGAHEFSPAFSPDGKRLAGAATDNTVKVWDAHTGQELRTLEGHTGQVLSVAFNADGTRLASASADHTVKVWDAQTGPELFSFKIGPGVSVPFSPDGKRVANGSGRRQGLPKGWDGVPGEVKVWDTETGQVLLTVKANGGRAFSPDGKRLATSHRPGGLPGPSGPGEVKVWDAQTGQEVCTLKGAGTKSVVFSPDGKRVASSERWTNTVQVWDAQTGEVLLNLKAKMGEINSLAFSPNGHWLIGDPGGAVTIWDATPRPEK